MERFVRVLAVFFWVAATLFVALLFTAGLSYDFVVGLLGSERLETVLGGLAGDSSGLLRPHRVARVPGEPRGGYYVRAGDGEGSLLRYHLLDRPIPVLLLRPGGVLRCIEELCSEGAGTGANRPEPRYTTSQRWRAKFLKKVHFPHRISQSLAAHRVTICPGKMLPCQRVRSGACF